MAAHQSRHTAAMRSALFQTLQFGKDMGSWLRDEQLRDGAVVFREGDPGDRFYLIISGIALVTQGQGLAEKIVARLGPGQYFGELALIHNVPRAASIRADGQLRIISLSSEKFLGLYGDNPELREQLKHLSGFYSLPKQKAVLTLHADMLMGKPSL